jgi:hypothetical protein
MNAHKSRPLRRPNESIGLAAEKTFISSAVFPEPCAQARLWDVKLRSARHLLRLRKACPQRRPGIAEFIRLRQLRAAVAHAVVNLKLRARLILRKQRLLAAGQRRGGEECRNAQASNQTSHAWSIGGAHTSLEGHGLIRSQRLAGVTIGEQDLDEDAVSGAI